MIKILENLYESKKEKSSLEKYFDKHEIKPEGDIYKNSIGFSEKEQKWYGWSHRAIFGFELGHECIDGDLGVGDGYTFKPGDKLKTLDDCKQMAKDFAKSVD